MNSWVLGVLKDYVKKALRQLKWAGARTSESSQRLPMFQATSNGAIVANPYASSALSEMMAMAQAANASGISPRGATGALRNGGAAGGGAIPDRDIIYTKGRGGSLERWKYRDLDDLQARML